MRFIKFFSSKGYQAIALYRLSHKAYIKHMKVIAHIIHNHNLKSTGVDINESAVIGENVFIPHPVGIVIGGQRVLEMIVP